MFTFESDLNKIDGDSEEALAGAEFTLYKKDTTVQSTADPDEVDSMAILAEGWKKVGEYEIGLDGSSFTLNGLDDGYYVLVETKTPDGYNTMLPYYFEIFATHVWDEKENHDVLKDLMFYELEMNDEGELKRVQDAAGVDKTFAKTIKIESGVVENDIPNFKGAVLPETGGIGTTIFYVVGGILVAGAGVLLVTKKRMSVEDK